MEINKISINENSSLKSNHYGSGFKEVGFHEGLILRHVWSPILFEQGVRRTSKFKAAYWGALDFDDGYYRLNEAIREWTDVICVIGTTKSHQAQKGDLPPCDRFRILFLWEEPITDYYTYQYNIKCLIDTYGADRACADGARFFYPCRQIMFRNLDLTEGYKAKVRTPERPQKTPEEIKEYFESYKASGTVPRWLTSLLNYGVPEGERNKACFKLGLYFAKLGYSLEEIYGRYETSGFGKGAGFSREEARQAIKNGYQTGKN